MIEGVGGGGRIGGWGWPRAKKRRENGSRELCVLHSAEIARRYGACITVLGPVMCIDLFNSYNNHGNRNFNIPIIQMSLLRHSRSK